MAECDTCDTCCSDGCEVCNSCQSFCELGQNSDNKFEFSRCVAKDEIIGPPLYDDEGEEISTWFTRDTWNEAIEQINAVYSAGDYSNAKDNCIDLNDSDDFMTFSEYKRVAESIDYTFPDEIKQNSVIYGKYFSDLADKIANLDYFTNQCNSCNTSCNTCETCEDCNAECDSCDSGCCETTSEEES